MEVIATKLVMPEHLNPGGTLFGGQMMAWMDKVAAMCAIRRALGNNVVTAKVEEINFKAPAKSGDQIELNAYVESVGNSSMKIRVKAEVCKPTFIGGRKKEIANSVFHMVQIDHDGRPMKLQNISELKIVG